MKLLRKYKLTIIGILLGAVAGWTYQQYNSCKDGQCLITSNPAITTLYGALIGSLAFNSFRKTETISKDKKK